MINEGRREKSMKIYQAKRDQMVYEIVQKWYEPGRDDRSKRWIYRNKVLPVLPMSERSFFRSLARHEKRMKSLK